MEHLVLRTVILQVLPTEPSPSVIWLLTVSLNGLTLKKKKIYTSHLDRSSSLRLSQKGLFKADR